METFKPLPYPFEAYEASDEGRIRTKTTGRILSQARGLDGYVRVGVVKRSKGSSTAYVHRLVALAHVPGDTSLTVNHKDLCKHNNIATNLEWTTLADNHKHLHKLRPELALARGLKRCKPVRAMRHEDGGSETYPSARDAAIALGHWNKSANICNALQRKTTAYARLWEFVEL